MERGLQKVNQHSRLVEWGRRVEACRNSGQRVSEWCGEHGIPVSTYYSWQRCQRHFKMSIFAEMECRFLLGSIQVLYSLIHHITCRLEARQALIDQLVSGLTGKNGKYNYSKAVHLYPPFFDIFCSPKNYKIAPALTACSFGLVWGV